MLIDSITSLKNPKIKKLLSLQGKSKYRKEHNSFLVEGQRELRLCVDNNFVVKSIFVCSEIIGNNVLNKLIEKLTQKHHDSNAAYHSLKPYNDVTINYLDKSIYKTIAYRGSTEGIIAEIEYKERPLEDLCLEDNPLIIVLERIEKPGNIGAILRSADAVDADAVIICDPLTDIYNPNIIRASLGTVFSRQIAICSSQEAITYLKEKKINIYTAQLQDSSFYYKVDFKKATAIVMGSENEGLSDLWREAADLHIKIPMLGQADSLNVSVSAAVLLYEVLRQRNFSLRGD